MNESRNLLVLACKNADFNTGKMNKAKIELKHFIYATAGKNTNVKSEMRYIKHKQDRMKIQIKTQMRVSDSEWHIAKILAILFEYYSFESELFS